MIRYLLDTNIVSEVTKSRPQPTIIEWLTRQADATLFLSTFTLAEIRRGILQMPTGRKRQILEDWYTGTEGPELLFAGRILAFDAKAAEAWARMMADGHAAGLPRNPLDMILAATARANDCVVVTANDMHFAGAVETLNPAHQT